MATPSLRNMPSCASVLARHVVGFTDKQLGETYESYGTVIHGRLVFFCEKTKEHSFGEVPQRDNCSGNVIYFFVSKQKRGAVLENSIATLLVLQFEF